MIHPLSINPYQSPLSKTSLPLLPGFGKPRQILIFHLPQHGHQLHPISRHPLMQVRPRNRPHEQVNVPLPFESRRQRADLVLAALLLDFLEEQLVVGLELCVL